MCKLITLANKEDGDNGNPAVLDVLKQYKVSRDYDGNYAKVNTCKKPDLVETLIFLHGTTAEKAPEMKAEYDELLKKALVTKLLTRIENLQPELCKACQKDYYFEPAEASTLRCVTCGRGACHECWKTDEALWGKLAMRDAGLHFTCSPCMDSFLQQRREQDNDERKGKGGKKTGKVVSVPEVIIESSPTQGLEEQANKSDDKPKEDNVSESEEESEEESEDEEFNETRRQKKNRMKKERMTKKESMEKCKHFMKNKCKHGISGEKCRFYHPKRCQKWMKAGKDGCKKCELFHPALCYGSINDRKCSKPECSYIHLPGTVRTSPKSKDGDKESACPRAGGQKKLDCIMCPRVFNTETELSLHINTAHCHKCAMCKGEFSYKQDLVDHKCQAHRGSDGGPAKTYPTAGDRSKHFLEEQPEKELLQSVNIMMEAMKQSQIQNQNMFSQMIQQQQNMFIQMMNQKQVPQQQQLQQQQQVQQQARVGPASWVPSM